MNVIEFVLAPAIVEMPILAEIQPAQNLSVRVRWARGLRVGRTDTVDLTPLVNSFKFFKPLRDNAELFQTVQMTDDGHAVVWGDGKIDMAATSIERLAEETLSSDDFKDFLSRNCLTHNAAAAILGRSRRQIENYLGGNDIPRVVALACMGYEARLTSPTHTSPSKQLRIASAQRHTITWTHTQASNLFLEPPEEVEKPKAWVN